MRFVADENFNNEIVRGLLHRRPQLDLVRVQDVGLLGAEDPDVLAWAAENERILLTHDLATMSDFAYDRVAHGEAMPGVFILNDRIAIGLAIREIILVVECTGEAEWNGRVVHLPL